MPRIPSYPLIGSLSNDDLMIIDDVSLQYATKSVELQSLKGYFNTGQATTTYVDDKVVSGAAFNNGVLTLTRTDGVDVTQNLDGRYALTSSLATVATTGSYSDLTEKPTTITQTQANEIAANTLKTSFPGFGTTEGTALAGNTAIPTNTSDLNNDSGYVTGTASTDPSTTAVAEIKTLTATEYGSETKQPNVMYVIV